MAVARPTNWLDPDYSEVLRERHERLKRIRRDDAWDQVIAYYRAGHYREFVEDWVTTFVPWRVPMGKTPDVPFLLFPKQAELFDWLCERWNAAKGRPISEQEQGLIEKSREMGASWVCLAFALCVWLFEARTVIAVGSRKEPYVDEIGDMDSLLEKFRYMVLKLPEELRPIGYVPGKHDRRMKIENPETKSLIKGEAGTNIGRGGRASLYLVDEAMFLEDPESIEAALSQNAKCRIDLSSVNGTGGPFYKKRFSGNIPVFTLKWTDDPRKDDAWYANQCATKDPKVVAQEIDLDYEASGEESVIYSSWVRASQALRRKLAKSGELRALFKKYQHEGVAGMDVGGGRNFSVVVPRFGPIVQPSIKWKDTQDIDTPGRASRVAVEAGCSILKYDSVGIGHNMAARFRQLNRIKVRPVNAGGKPSRRVWPDKKTSRDKFANLKAELWWIARDKLRATYEHWMFTEGQGGIQHPLDDLLLLPEDATLCGELSLVGYSETDSGKTTIEKKRQLRARGIESPDHAEALILSFAPAPPRAASGKTRGYY